MSVCLLNGPPKPKSLRPNLKQCKLGTMLKAPSGDLA